jgi:hypothetical protein
MKNWVGKNYKTLIIAAFLIPIFTVALVSISHVTKWYGISNPVSWSIYLSIGIEIAALSALAAISADMGKKVYFPFALVTLVQFIGNIFFAYSYININDKSFTDWVDLTSPFVELLGVDPTDLVGHKRFLAFFAGGMLPIISLSFLHMLVKFTEEDRLKGGENNVDENLVNNVEAKDIIGEVSRLRLSDKDLEILEKHLLNPEGPNEKLKQAAQRYSDEVREKHTHVNDFDETSVKPQLTREERGEILAEMMKNDQELGLYDEPFDNPLIKEEKEDISDWDVTLMDGLEDEEPFFTEEELEKIFQEEPTEEEIQENFSTIEPNTENIFQEEVTPGLSDEEVMEMNQDEYERMLDSDEYLTQAIEEFNQQSIEDEKEVEVEVVLETPDENVINVVIDEDVLVPPTQSEPLPTPQEQVISVDFSIPNDTIETPAPENPTLENTDVEKKNS